MNEFRADVHCHTTCSDGTLTPEETLKLAHTIGLSGLSITDHDTIEAYKTAIPMAQALKVLLVSGIEFSAMHNETSVHVLAYSFPLDSTIIQDFCQKHSRRRTVRNRQILDLLAERGFAISESDIQEMDPKESLHSIGRPHIALAMVKKGYVSSIQEAFNLYIGDGKPCFASGGYFTVEETVELIHQANGFAIIAHPHLINEPEILQDVLRMNFDGIEGYYARFAAHHNERWLELGQKRGWIITGGSDFHGQIKPANPLGSSWVNQETFQVLYQRFIENNPSCALPT